MSLTHASLLSFLKNHRYAVQSSTHATGGPQSAVVGVAVSDDFEIIFDTLESSRKAQNLRERPEIALVIGGLSDGEEQSVQYEGLVDEPEGPDRIRLVELYLSVFPDGVERQSWPGLIYFRAKPTWIRYSDYSVEPAEIVELNRSALERFK